jgi:hypothetical protein
MSKTPGCLAAVVMASATTALAQSLPTSQPNILQIFREEVKVGHTADHAKVEAGWPAAFEKAKSPYTYIALVSMTGRDEAWFVVPFESHQAIADSLKREEEPTLAPVLERLSKADADQVSSARSILAMARKDLSHGAFPDTAKQRYFDVLIFQVKPGHQRAFEAAAKAYGAAADRGAPQTSYRVYQVMAGMPSPTFLIFSSVTSYGEFDKVMADGVSIMKAATEEERNTLEQFSAEGLISSETIRFKLDPVMSYVPQDVKALDPEFWMPKPAPKPAPAPASARQPEKPESKR